MQNSPAFLPPGLQRFKKPTAVFFDNQSELNTLKMPPDRMVRRYTLPSDFQAGMAVGKFLFALGHHNVCCWLEGSELQWASNGLLESAVHSETRG